MKVWAATGVPQRMNPEVDIFVFYWRILTTIGRFAMKFGTDIQGAKRMDTINQIHFIVISLTICTHKTKQNTVSTSSNVCLVETVIHLIMCLHAPTSGQNSIISHFSKLNSIHVKKSACYNIVTASMSVFNCTKLGHSYNQKMRTKIMIQSRMSCCVYIWTYKANSMAAHSCKWGVWILFLCCQSQVYASASCCGSCRSGAEGKEALTDERRRSVAKQREKYGGSEREEHHRKCNKEAESETVKGLLFCSARTQRRRRYFMCFPVGVWPPGAAPTSACLSGYKLSAADVTEWRETGLWGGAVEVIFGSAASRLKSPHQNT